MTQEEVKKVTRIIIVDDDHIHNAICAHLIRKILPQMEVKLFTEPLKALDFIKTDYAGKPEDVSTLLLLDINMPKMTGWDFLDVFKDFGSSIHDQFTIYILSSSVDKRDRQRAEVNPFINDFMSKPLTLNHIEGIVATKQLDKV